MEELREVLMELLNENLYQIIISNSSKKEHTTKIKIRPILQKDQLLFQASSYVGTKVLHKNYEKSEMAAEVILQMQHYFKQIEIESRIEKITALVSKKGKVTIKRAKNTVAAGEKHIELEHNRTKNYLLQEGQAVPFLIDLGIQTKEGKIVQAKYDKFKQINRYLEFVEDILYQIQKKETITIIDFGCGKAYLTFALYYYLTVLKGFSVKMIGLDLKEDVIHTCNELKNKYGYEGLHFIQGDIGNYQGEEEVDMVVTLHACDTATDFALQKAVRWNAKVIFSVPCCQHEVNKQIKNELWEPVLKYGIIKERISALITDAIRANVLERNGYDTQILEFIDMEHTPKNLLIRAVKKENPSKESSEITNILEEMNISPMITRVL